MNNIKSIVFDIDDTCGDLKIRLQNIYRNATGNHDISFNDWLVYNAKDRYGITSDELTELFINDNSLALMDPHEGVGEVVSELKSKGFNIEFVTARGWHPDGYNVTRQWLEDHKIKYDRINIVPLFQCKEEATRHIHNIELFIDDRLDHCQSMAKSGRVNKCLLYDQPWNRDNNDTENSNKIIRIHKIYDVLELI